MRCVRPQVWADAQAAAGGRAGPRQVIISRCGTMAASEAAAWVAAVDGLYQMHLGCQQPQQLCVASVVVQPMMRHAIPPCLMHRGGNRECHHAIMTTAFGGDRCLLA